MTLLSVQSLSKSYGAHPVVDGVSFDIAPGEVLALIGPNGAGKTTTFNIINGQIAADSGRVQLDGQDILGLAPARIAGLGVGRTFQVAATFGSLTVLENVQTAFMAHHGLVYRWWLQARGLYREHAMAVLEQVAVAHLADLPCRALSYGDVKRVELAMALAGRPRLLLMDEPTAGMAPAERNALMARVRALATAQRIGVLFTEHSMDVVFACADRIIVMAAGRVVAHGRPDEVRVDPEVRRVYFGGMSGAHQQHDQARSAGAHAVRQGPPPAGAVGTGDTVGVSANAAGAGGAGDAADASDIGGHASVTLSGRGSGADRAGPALLALENVNAWYGAAHILFDVSMEVGHGEVVALMGRNGAGKSTTLKTIMGMLARRSGRIRFRGHELSALSPHRIARLGMAYVPEDRRIFSDLTVIENLRTGQQPARNGRSAGAMSWTMAEIFALFPVLARMKDRRGDQMSGGEQQMLAVARTLMGNPGLVLLDEPSEGVAPIVVESMVAMIRTLKQRGVSVVLSEQNMDFAALVADRVYVLEKGQIRYTGTMSALLADESVQRSYLTI